MIRGVVAQQIDHDPHFRWRGTDVTRIENLSDIAFALSLGMLITGASAPTTIAELNEFLLYIVPTAAGFAILLTIWQGHYTFYRRYGLVDHPIIVLNAVLIFVVLFMAYPLRFTFDSLFVTILDNVSGDFSRSAALGVNSFAASGRLVASFAASYSAAFALLALMTRHALKRADDLQLNAYERASTRQLLFVRWGECMIAAAVSLLAWFSPIYSLSGALLGFLFLPHTVVARFHPLPDPAPQGPSEN